MEAPFAVFRYYPRTWGKSHHFIKFKLVTTKLSSSDLSVIAELAELDVLDSSTSSSASASTHSFHSSNDEYDPASKEIDITPLQYLPKPEDQVEFSPLSIISEGSEPASSSTSSIKSSERQIPSSYTHRNQNIEDSPLRIPRMVATPATSPIPKARPPTPPTGPTSEKSPQGRQSRQTVRSSVEHHAPISPLSPSTVGSRDRFAQVVRSKYCVDAVRNSDGHGMRRENQRDAKEDGVVRKSSNASKAGGGLGVSALRKVFETRGKGK